MSWECWCRQLFKWLIGPLCKPCSHTFGSKWPWLGLVVCRVIFVFVKRPNLIIEILSINSRVWKLKPSLLGIPHYFEEGCLWCMFPLVIGTFETSYGILLVENWSSVFLYIASFLRWIFFLGNLIGKIEWLQSLFPTLNWSLKLVDVNLDLAFALSWIKLIVYLHWSLCSFNHANFFFLQIYIKAKWKFELIAIWKWLWTCHAKCYLHDQPTSTRIYWVMGNDHEKAYGYLGITLCKKAWKPFWSCSLECLKSVSWHHVGHVSLNGI